MASVAVIKAVATITTVQVLTVPTPTAQNLTPIGALIDQEIGH